MTTTRSAVEDVLPLARWYADDPSDLRTRKRPRTVDNASRAHGLEHDPGPVSVSRDITAPFTAYVRARQHALIRFAFLLTGNQEAAEDLVQTALAKAYLAWHRIDAERGPDAYVHKIIVNENTSVWRRAWRRREISTDEVPERPGAFGSPVDFDAAGSVGTRDEVWRLIQRLPRRQRAAVVLRYYEDLSEAETAEVLECSVGTVKSQTSRAMASLRKMMESADGGAGVVETGSAR